MDIDEEDEEQLEELIKMGNKQKEKLVIQYEDEAEEPSRLVSHKRPSSSKELDWWCNSNFNSDHITLIITINMVKLTTWVEHFDERSNGMNPALHIWLPAYVITLMMFNNFHIKEKLIHNLQTIAED